MNSITLIGIVLLLGVALVSGCTVQAKEKDNSQSEVLVFVVEETKKYQGYCDLLAATDYKGEKVKDKDGDIRDKRNEIRDLRIDGQVRTTTLANEFRMLDHEFSQKIGCNTNDDCYEYLLDSLEYRSIAPEFEPYLHCETFDVDGFDSKPEMFSN